MAKNKKPVPVAPKPKFSPKQIKAMAATPIPKPAPRRGDPQIGAKRHKEARSAAIGRGILKQL